MAAYGIEALAACREFEVTFLYNPLNSKWKRRIDAFGDSNKLVTGECPTRTRKLQLLRNKWQRCKALREHFDACNPDLILFIQGDIEHSSLALSEALRMGLPVASYIPMCHSYKLMQAKLAGFRDGLAGQVYRSVNKWITISDTISKDLMSLSPGSTVAVVNNGIQISKFTGAEDDCLRSQVREELGLDQDDKICAVVGRIEFNQKCQDLALKALEQFPAAFDGWRLLFVGSGPDDVRLDQQIADSSWNSRIKRIPWLDNPERIYAAIDCLLIPSRYEGVPLVMLEALAAGVPVIGSDRDGMRDILPMDWRFESGSIKEFSEAFSRAAKTGFKDLDATRDRVLREYDLSGFKSEFVDAVRLLVGDRC